MLIDGKWTAKWQPVQATDAKGGYVRQISSFRHWITPDGAAGPTGEAGFKAEIGRYHLYVALICPWASRTLIARKLKQLEAVISVCVVEPILTDEGWRFGDYPGSDWDGVNGATYLHEIYTRADPHFTGRATVPVLWDKQRKMIVNNESADIMRMINSGFGALAGGEFDLYPKDLRAGIDALNDRVYPRLNQGVYRAGFATSQVAYEEAFADVFTMLEELEERVSRGGPFLFGDRPTETDVRLFVTLVRFDAAYHSLFKCNLRRLTDYSALSAYLARILTVPGVRETVNMDHIKRGYYSIKALNPTGIVPVGPIYRDSIRSRSPTTNPDAAHDSHSCNPPRRAGNLDVDSLVSGAKLSRTPNSRGQMRHRCWAIIPAVTASKRADRDQPAEIGPRRRGWRLTYCGIFIKSP